MKIANNEIDALNNLANWAREVGDMNDALQAYNVAYRLATEHAYVHGQLHALLGQAKIFKLSKNLDDMGKNVHLAGELIGLEREDEITLWENQAEFAGLQDDWNYAAELWQKIINTRSKDDAYLGRSQEHLAEALYKLGKKDEARDLVTKAVETLLRHKIEGDYVWNVWYSGALMKLFYITQSTEVQQSLEEILLDPRLGHRRRQWEELKCSYAKNN